MARSVAGGYASAGLLAYVVISKYQHHLPLCRIEAMSAQWGSPLSRKPMVDWVRIAADWGEPIYKLMLAELLRGHINTARDQAPKVVYFFVRIIGWFYESEQLWSDEGLTESELQRHRSAARSPAT